MAVVSFYVKDANTGAPIAGAYVRLVCQYAGGGTIPYESHSDANGYVSIDIDGNTPVLYWSVSASDYQDASGSGYPPSTVYMSPAVLGHIVHVYYYFERVGNWVFFWTDKQGLLYPYHIMKGETAYFAPGWINDSTVAIVGHIDLELISPSGVHYFLPATLNQDRSADPGNGWTVQFAPIVMDEAGNWTMNITLRKGAEGIILDTKSIVFPVEGPTHTLTVNSSPITGIPFTIDGATGPTTPYSGSLPEGAHTIVMPSTYSNYKFDHWEDGSTNPTRTINLTSDMTLTAYYSVSPTVTGPTGLWQFPLLQRLANIFPRIKTLLEQLKARMSK